MRKLPAKIVANWDDNVFLRSSQIYKGMMMLVLVSNRQRNAASQKLSKLMILACYFIHVWIGVAVGLHFGDFRGRTSKETDSSVERKEGLCEGPTNGGGRPL